MKSASEFGPNSPDYRELANAIARQAEALAQGAIPEGQVYAQVHRLKSNVDTLVSWSGDDRKN